MPPWLLTALGWARWPFSRGLRWLNERGVAKRELVREGSAIITPVSEFIGKAHPAYFVWSEQVLASSSPPFHDIADEWRELRPRLLDYANQHPSDEVRRLGNELAEAIERLLLVPLRGPVQSVEATALYESAVKLNERARDLCEQLLKEIRDF
jgi:hypothetical protein